MKTISIQNSGEVVTIDDIDFEKVSAYKWFLYYKKKNKRKQYVKSTTKINGKQLDLHVFIFDEIDLTYRYAYHRESCGVTAPDGVQERIPASVDLRAVIYKAEDITYLLTEDQITELSEKILKNEQP